MSDNRDEYRKEWSAEMRAAAAEDDAGSSEKWNEGCDFAMMQLCIVLGVDPRMVNWDAATETVDGDVQAVVGNIFLVKFGENWADRLR